MIRLARYVWLAAASAAVTVSPASADTVVRRGDRTTVTAPTTRVETDRRGTSVRVVAPTTRVHVDTRARSVRVRVPYFNRDIRW